jgi:glutathione synthase/RimK-type ligase-like ATP-grasp enzyme
MRVAVLRCENLPSIEDMLPSPEMEEVLFGDDRLLVEAIVARGHLAESLSWQSPRLLQGEFDLAVVRSAWDYFEQRDRFLDTLARIESSGCRVVNSVDTIRWNSHKHYLFDLRALGIPIVPTFDADRLGPSDTAGWQGAIVKPVVGGGGKSVRRVDVGEAADLGPGFLAQPFVDSVISEGEWMFIYFGGELSHTLLKKPKAGDFRAHAIYGGSTEVAAPSGEDIRHVHDMVARLPARYPYARLDLIRYEGKLAIIELELIEPALYMQMAPGSADRLAEALAIGDA